MAEVSVRFTPWNSWAEINASCHKNPGKPWNSTSLVAAALKSNMVPSIAKAEMFSVLAGSSEVAIAPPETPNIPREAGVTSLLAISQSATAAKSVDSSWPAECLPSVQVDSPVSRESTNSTWKPFLTSIEVGRSALKSRLEVPIP